MIEKNKTDSIISKDLTKRSKISSTRLKDENYLILNRNENAVKELERHKN